jgi:hypothetical protein
MENVLKETAEGEFVVKSCARVGCGNELRIPVSDYLGDLEKSYLGQGEMRDGYFVSSCKRYFCGERCFNDDVDC